MKIHLIITIDDEKILFTDHDKFMQKVKEFKVKKYTFKTAEHINVQHIKLYEPEKSK